MLDTMTLTKVVASICGAFLVLLLGKWAADGLYAVDGHGEQAYAIAVAESTEAEEVADAVPFAQLYVEASAEDGEGLWRQCQACHQLEDGANGVGPHLYGVVGRDKGAVDGYAYSEVLASMEGDWTPENLDGFLLNPKGYAPGTKMGYAGLKDAEDRADLIAYLNTFDGSAPPESYADAAAASAAEEAPADEAAAEEAPAEEMAAEGDAPAEETAAEETAVEEAPAEDAAAEEAPAEDAPAEETAAEEAPAEEAPAEETAAEESTAEDAPTEEAAAEEAPAEEAPAEETAAEDAPAEEQVAAADTAAGDEAEAPAEDGGSEFTAILAAADAGAGERLWRQCAACHKLEDGARASGPHLAGIVGRDIASVDGFRYSDALTSLEGDWTPERLSAWLENPKEFAPGNRMSFRGLPELEDRANLIAYLEQAAN